MINLSATDRFLDTHGLLWHFGTVSESHLYPGFKYAGRLPSVAVQREIQRSLVESIIARERPTSILSVGCGFGDELEEILGGFRDRNQGMNLWAIDLAPVGKQVCDLNIATKLGSRFHWQQLDLLNQDRLPDYGAFNLSQCGFVLHDIERHQKEKAYEALVGAIRAGGWFVLSDIFPKYPFSLSGPDAENYRREVRFVYNSFLAEANDAREQGILSHDEWHDLVGDEHGPGLKNTLREATAGSRDFFETLPQTEERLVQAGFIVEQVITNPINSRLAVILASRPRTLPL